MNPAVDKFREALARLTTGQKVQLGLALVATLALVWVENIPFDETALTVEEGSGVSVWDRVTRILPFASLPITVLLLAFLVLRPAIAALKSLSATEPELGDGGPPTVAQLQARVQAQLASGEIAALGEGGSPLKRKLMEAVSEDPKAAALVVRSWLEHGQGHDG